MSDLDGGTLLGRALVDARIDMAFGLCGGHIMPALYGMRKAGIEMVDVRHECSAMYAAIAYTRASGKIAAVVTTAGPGVANTTAGMMDAASMNIPVLHIDGAVAMPMRDAGDLQDMSTLDLMKSVSKWARKITIAERIPEYVSTAIRQATGADPGPASRPPVLPTPIPGGDPILIEQAADLLANAQRPAMLIDDGAAQSIGEHGAAIAELSDFVKMPIGVAGFGCRGMFGDESENRLLTNNATVMADVVLAMGCRFDFRLGFGGLLPADAKIIQVHTDTSLIGFNARADLGIVGGAGPVAKQILDAVKTRRDRVDGESSCGRSGPITTADLPAAYHDPKTPVHPGRCAGEAARFLEDHGRDWSLVVDGGEAAIWMGQPLANQCCGTPATVASASTRWRWRPWPGSRSRSCA